MKAYNPGSLEFEVGRLSQGQPGLYRINRLTNTMYKILSLKTKHMHARAHTNEQQKLKIMLYVIYYS